MALSKEKQKQADLRKRILVEFQSQDESQPTATELRKKIMRLARYIKRTDHRISVYRRKLRDLRDLKKSEKQKVEEGLYLYNLKNKRAVEL